MIKEDFTIMFKESILELKATKPIKNLVFDLTQDLKLHKTRNYIPTGIKSLDCFLNGWKNAELIVIASRPAMGKTSFALTLLLNASVQFNKSVAYFTLNENAKQITKKIFSITTGMSIQKLNKNGLNSIMYEKLQADIETLSEAPIFIEDSMQISIEDLKYKAYQLKNKYNIEMLIIDDIQQITHDDKNLNETQIQNYIAKSLKELAIYLDIPIFILSQLSRSVEIRGGDKRPLLSDLRQSEELENCADTVIFIYKAEYYGIIVDEYGVITKDETELIFAKHKNGPLDSVKIKFDANIGCFRDFNE